jgi:hypothetical protein
MGGWVDPKAIMDDIAKRKMPISARDQTPVIKLVAYSLC